jgi:integrase
MAAATDVTSSLVPVQLVFTDAERLALAGFLAGYRGLTREAYTLDLRQFTGWCRTRSLPLFSVRRADIETFARELEALGRARATVTPRLCTIAGFYKYAVEEELLDHSPAAHVRRPRLDYESHATALDRNELGALLVAAGLGPPGEHALISLLALNGLRVSEATGADIEHLGLERGHRTLVITRKGGKVVTIPLAPRTARAIDLAIGERTSGPLFTAADGRRLDRHGCPDRPPGHPPRPDRQARRPAHAAACVHHRSPRCRGAATGRARGRLARRPAHHHALRPGPDQPGPPCHLHCRHLRRRSSEVAGQPRPVSQPGRRHRRPGWPDLRARPK